MTRSRYGTGMPRYVRRDEVDAPHAFELQMPDGP